MGRKRCRTGRWRPWGMVVLLFLAGLLLDAFLQARPAAELDVGGRDLGYVEGFSAKEAGKEGTYRWMGARGLLRLGPVRAGRPLLLRLRMGSGRPPDVPWPLLQVQVDGRELAAFSLSPAPAEYALLLPPEALHGGELAIELAVAAFRESEPPHRNLGLMMEWARLETLDGRGSGFPWGMPRPAYALVGVAVALLAWALGVPFGAAWVPGAASLALAALLTPPFPDDVLRAGPTLGVLLLLAALTAGLLRFLSPRWRGWAHRLAKRAPLILLLAFFLSLLLAFSPSLDADGIQYYAYLRSLALDGDLHFANEFSPEMAALFPHVPSGLSRREAWTKTGYVKNFASVGPAVVWAPFFAIGHLLALGGRALGLPWTTDGYSEPYIALIGFASALSALVTLLLGYDLVRRLYGPAPGLLATLAAFLGTPLFYYAFYEPDFAHALASCGVTLFLYLWVRHWGERSPVRWFLLGLAAGWMSTLYWIDALFFLLPAGEALWEASRILRGPASGRLREMGRLAGGIFLFGGAALLAFAPQMIVWKIIFGRFLTYPQEGLATPAGFAPLALLLSPLHGLLPWTPLAVLGMAGLFFLAREKRPWGIWVLLGLALYFGYNATLESWHGGGTFGLRRLTNAFPFFLLGIAALLERLRRWRTESAVAAALVSVFWSGMVLLRFLTYALPHHPAELAQLSLEEFLLAPTNMPLERLPEMLRTAFFVRWMESFTAFRPASWLYGLVLLLLFGGLTFLVWRALERWLWKERGRPYDTGTASINLPSP
ncbi:MAG: hypothetical protein ACP5OO_12175 [Chloroflexia bacterium]